MLGSAAQNARRRFGILRAYSYLCRVMKKTIIFLLVCLSAIAGRAQSYPSVDPKATFTTVEGDEIDDASSAQSAPLAARFTANPSDIGEYSARYEWKIYRPGEEHAPLLHRFEEDIEFTFTESGSFYVQLYATFILGTDTIVFPDEGEANPIQVSISESRLEFPNAFSPNGDGFNDVYRAKDGYQSIVSFKATIFNRWGQKIYSWDSPDGGWDGTWNGRTVKDGVYFVVVQARGADGRKYNIRRDVNVLTGYENSSSGYEQ